MPALARTAAGPGAASASVAITLAANDLRICELPAACYRHTDSYDVEDGKPTGEAANINDATRPRQWL